MAAIKAGQKVRLFHPGHRYEPFRALVIGFEDDGRAVVRALEPVRGTDGEVLFNEGEYLAVGVEHAVEDDE